MIFYNTTNQKLIIKVSLLNAPMGVVNLGTTGIDSLLRSRVSMPGVDGISRPEQIVKTITGEYNYAMAA